jgi:hypothetical protein
MKKKIILWLPFAMIFLQGICLAQAPHEVAGFTLGKNIADYKGKVKMETSIPIRYMEYISEVEIQEMEGFKSGLLAYGNCDSPGKILRIKLKYADSSKAFFNQLLKRFKARFGEPAEWRGDSFHVVIAWKWAFTDQDNNRISMILQHNTLDEEEKIGNSLKLTMTNRFEQERICFESKEPETARNPEQTGQEGNKKPVDWDRFIPR